MKNIIINVLDDEGTYERCEYENDLLNGVKEIRTKEHLLLSQARYVNGKLNGLCQQWNDNGALRLRFTCTDGKYDGDYISFWDNEVCKEIGTFKAGERVGVYRWYKHDGSLWKEHIYPEAD